MVSYLHPLSLIARVWLHHLSTLLTNLQQDFSPSALSINLTYAIDCFHLAGAGPVTGNLTEQIPKSIYGSVLACSVPPLR